jgi:hypothetical protein
MSSLRRRVVSGLILLHFFAILAATNVASPPESPVWGWFAGLFRPYVNAADLNHGYRFFAPDPGPSHLVEYELTMPSGKVEKGRFPDRRQEWPRLLYHRYFMLAEHLNMFYMPVQEAQDQLEDPRLKSEVRIDIQNHAEEFKKQYRRFAESYGRELLRRTGAVSVKLQLVEHGIPPAPVFASGKTRLDDQSLYMPLGEPVIVSAEPQAEELR